MAFLILYRVNNTFLFPPCLFRILHQNIHCGFTEIKWQTWAKLLFPIVFRECQEFRFLLLLGKEANLRTAKSFVSWNISTLHSTCVIFGLWQLAGLLRVPRGSTGNCTAQSFQRFVGWIWLPVPLPWPWQCLHLQWLHLQGTCGRQSVNIFCTSCFLFPVLDRL